MENKTLWQAFEMTGNPYAYMLYKGVNVKRNLNLELSKEISTTYKKKKDK